LTGEIARRSDTFPSWRTEPLTRPTPVSTTKGSISEACGTLAPGWWTHRLHVRSGNVRRPDRLLKGRRPRRETPQFRYAVRRCTSRCPGKRSAPARHGRHRGVEARARASVAVPAFCGAGSGNLRPGAHARAGLACVRRAPDARVFVRASRTTVVRWPGSSGLGKNRSPRRHSPLSRSAPAADRRLDVRASPSVHGAPRLAAGHGADPFGWPAEMRERSLAGTVSVRAEGSVPVTCARIQGRSLRLARRASGPAGPLLRSGRRLARPAGSSTSPRRSVCRSRLRT